MKFTENLLNDEQNGFRKNRSCEDHLAAFHMLCDSRLKQHKDIFVALIDFSKAYDHIVREYLWLKLRKYGVHGKMYNALLSLHFRYFPKNDLKGLHFSHVTL